MLAWKITLTVVHALALTTAFTRVVQRTRRKLLWWDDYLILLPSALDFTGILILWLQPPVTVVNGVVHFSFIFSPWTFGLVCISVIWLSRISLLLSLARIYMPGHPSRRLALCFSAVFFLLYFASLMVMTFSCTATSSTNPWWNADYQKCYTEKNRNSLMQGSPDILFALDLTSDLILVVGPLYILWHIKLPKTERVLVLVLFASSALTLIITIVYFIVVKAVQGKSGAEVGFRILIMSRLQASVSLLAANLLVVTMFAYRTIRRKYGLPSPLQPQRDQKTSMSEWQPDKNESERREMTNPPHHSGPPLTPITMTVLSGRDFDASEVSYDSSSSSRGGGDPHCSGGDSNIFIKTLPPSSGNANATTDRLYMDPRNVVSSPA